MTVIIFICFYDNRVQSAQRILIVVNVGKKTNLYDTYINF